MKIIKRIFYIISTIVFLSTLGLTLVGFNFIYNAFANFTEPIIDDLSHPQVSMIYDSDNHMIKQLGVLDAEEAKFDDLPDVFINALLSIEDNRFFIHDGYDIARLLASVINNIEQGRFAEGGSTLTQQIIKNKLLDNSKNLERKILELIMANRLEEIMTKEEIFMIYVNQILFDGVKPGINHACDRFFSKNVSQINLAEAAMLAAMVKSPTIYSPILNKENAQNRKNLVLDLMVKNNYISGHAAEVAKKITIDELLVMKPPKIEDYKYQSYLDVVYKEVFELTGYDPHTEPMNIYTYMDNSVQSTIDDIQNNVNENVVFTDNLQQIAGVFLDNTNDTIIGVMGGRDYQGEKIYNRAINMLAPPASTIKPILSYSLAIENFNWTNEHVVIDQPYYYPGSSSGIRNVDRIYMGELTLEEALGYSRNTVAAKLLEQAVDVLGVNYVTEYMDNIGILDGEVSDFNLAYSIGSFVYGLTPLQLANSYKMLPNGGSYSKSTTIKSIELLRRDEVITPQIDQEQILSTSTTQKLSTVLNGVVERNYWGLGSLNIGGRKVYAKSGTSSFDSTIIEKNNYPSNASKDIWIAGYTPSYTTIIWSGFDQYLADTNTYFSSSDTRRQIPRKIFLEVMGKTQEKRSSIISDDNLVRMRIIKGVYPYVLADQTIPESAVTYSYFDKNNPPTGLLKEPEITNVCSFSTLYYEDKLEVTFIPLDIEIKDPNYKTIFSYEKIYGQLIYVLEVTDEYNITTVYKNYEHQISLPLPYGFYKLKGYYSYENNLNYRSNEYIIDYDNTYFID